MIGKEVKGEEQVSLSKVKEILEERKKGKELTYEQQLAYEHAKKFSTIEGAKEQKLVKALLAAGISEAAAMKVTDIMPKNVFTLRQMLMKENRTFTDEEVNKILALIKEHA